MWLVTCIVSIEGLDFSQCGTHTMSRKRAEMHAWLWLNISTVEAIAVEAEKPSRQRLEAADALKTLRC